MNRSDSLPGHDREAYEGEHATPFQTDSLVGSFFHGDTENQWQGVVVAEVAPQLYLVELFEWFVGSSTHQRLVPLTDMSDWRFYDDAEWMNNASNEVQARWAKSDIPQ